MPAWWPALPACGQARRRTRCRSSPTVRARSLADVRVMSRLRCDNGEIAPDWALGGCGLILKSPIYVALDIAAGRLVQVLPEWENEPAPVCALFPRQRQMPTRVRLFVDALASHLSAFVAANR